jgi:hypothetical protein
LNLAEIAERMEHIRADATPQEARKLLPGSVAETQHLLADLRIAISGDGPAMVARSKETSTHFVWVVASSSLSGARLCLHQFKRPSTSSVSHANTIHNHRYNFASLILRGGYIEQVYDLDDVGLEIDGVASVPEPTETRVSVGQTTMVHHRRFHRVDQLLPATLTLVMKAPPVTAHSVSIDVETGVVAAHYSWNERVRRLVDAVESAAAAFG